MTDSTQLLAAFIAFIACFLAIGAVWNTDSSKRRKTASGINRFGGVGGEQLGLSGPRIKQWLASAGYFGANAAVYYMTFLASMAFIGAIVGLMAARWIELDTFASIAFGAAGGLLFSKIPYIYINSKWQSRRSEVGDAMPLMLDMLDVTTAAGHSVDDAWDSVQRQMLGVSPALSEEMQLVSLEIRLGESRERALKEMAERTGVGDAAALASLLTQSERFGSGLSETFRAQAESMRQDYARTMEERAHQSSIKTILPITLLMLPALLLVTIFPFMVVVLRAFFTEI
ncbi:MAG: hypothetical protein CBC35_03190 [Planctomycetes bacterium TMED75]|nr:hypothetical protein [Planctomycetaceae bacterium]OUU94904.1 MAG: hypothetical protein CBC35_03190 [Planctomycetes bacterium TMED75]